MYLCILTNYEQFKKNFTTTNYGFGSIDRDNSVHVPVT